MVREVRGTAHDGERVAVLGVGAVVGLAGGVGDARARRVAAHDRRRVVDAEVVTELVADDARVQVAADPRLVARELAEPGYQVRTIAIGTNTDPYQPAERNFKIMRHLQIHPEFGGRTEMLGKPQRRIRGNRPLTFNDFRHAIGRHIKRPRQSPR